MAGFLDFMNMGVGQQANQQPSNGMGGQSQGQDWLTQLMQGAQQVISQGQNETMGQIVNPYEGVPDGLQEALVQYDNQGRQIKPSPQANFSQFTDPSGMVLPPKDGGQEAPIIDLPPGVPQYPAPQSYPANAGGGMPPAQGFQQPQGGQQPQGQASFSSLFNPIGYVDLSPQSTQPFQPNMFTRMGSAYNSGGLMGSLGALLTQYR